MAQSLTTEGSDTGTIQQPIGVIVPNSTPRARPDSNPEHHLLQGQYCRLELLNSNTSSIVIEQLYDAFEPTKQTHFTYLHYGPFESVDGLIQYIRTKELPRSNTILYTIIVNDRAVGFVSYLRIKENHGSIEIGHVNFSQQLVRTRQATEAIYLLLKHAFDTLGYRRVEWICYSLNAKSRQAALRYGFQYEGTRLKSEICKGRSRDNSGYSIVDDEWPLVKQEIERWLNKDNFDVNGEQLTRLNAAQVNPRNNKIST